jgi:serine/threonine protein phosphatase PrpC
MIKSISNPPFASATAPKQNGQENEDTLLCIKGNAGMAAAVLDGIGGAPDGEKASQQAAKFIFYNLNMLDYRLTPDEIAERLQKCLGGADRHLKQLAAAGQLNRDAGTTAVVAAVLRPPASDSSVCDVVVACAGDSRCFAFLPDNTLRSLTIDNDSGVVLVGWNMIRNRMAQTNQPLLSGVISEKELDTLEKRQVFLRRNIVDAVLTADANTPTPQYAVSMVRVSVGTRLILCSDGLVDNLSNLEIQEVLQKTPLEKAASVLLEFAEARSHATHLRAKPDDITVVQLMIGR